MCNFAQIVYFWGLASLAIKTWECEYHWHQLQKVMGSLGVWLQKHLGNPKELHKPNRIQ
jgi:hypothetical protein